MVPHKHNIEGTEKKEVKEIDLTPKEVSTDSSVLGTHSIGTLKE